MKVCSQEVHGCIFVTVVVQMVAWTIVSALLIYKGLCNLWIMEEGNLTRFMLNETISTNFTKTNENLEVKGQTTGIVMIAIASIMLIIGPAFLIMVMLEKCFRRKRFRKLPQEEPPPKYEDVVMEELVPSYSSLFVNEEHSSNRV